MTSVSHKAATRPPARSQQIYLQLGLAFSYVVQVLLLVCSFGLDSLA